MTNIKQKENKLKNRTETININTKDKGTCMRKTSHATKGSISLTTILNTCNALKKAEGIMSMEDYAKFRITQYQLGLGNHQTRRETREWLNLDALPAKTKVTVSK